MRCLLLVFALVAAAHAGPVDDFVAHARQKHGEAGERAARFLTDHMPPGDRESLSAAFLTEHLDLAFQARKEFPWAAAVPEDVFLNDVLPYAVFDEPRDPWRAEFLPMAREIVRDARTASEAAQALNREFFKRINVHYNTGRKRANQSARESMASGRATCTGLSIILAEACRAVGVPARAVGTPLWTNLRGNHTWVEIWDDDWHFAGADEYDAGGLDRGWFVGDASKARANEPRHAIYATSWKRDALSFPMVWARSSTRVAAVNVTARYAKPDTAATASAATHASLGIRLFDQPGGTRLVAKVCAVEPDGRTLAEAETKGGTTDLNDLARLDLKPGTEGRLRFTVEGETRELPFGPLAAGDPTVNAAWSQLAPVGSALAGIDAWLALPVANRPPDASALQAPLTKSEAAEAVKRFLADRLARLAAERKAEMEQKSITLDGKTLRWKDSTFGDAPPGERSLWISMHGGGNAPSAVNDRQWTNQSKLYQPSEGIYLAPRAPTDTWNLWHEAHIDPLFQRLIDDHVALAGVNPDKVYLLGYSAGGDGVWQLAPRMADRFAAAAMMAGHPNEASLLGLRNLPFAVFVGGNDAAYNRNRVVADRASELARLAEQDPGGYVHMARVYEGLGHWMERKDAEALPWMAGFRRKPWPTKIVWVQDDVIHRRFYWLEVPPDAPLADRAHITASIKDATITLTGDVPPGTALRLSDQLLDLDAPLAVVVNGKQTFSGRVTRRAADIAKSIEERADAASAANVILPVLTPADVPAR